MEKEKKYRRLRETLGYIISLIWDVFKYVLFVLLLVAAIIAEIKCGIVAKIIIFILLSWFGIVFIKKAMMRNSGEIRLKDFFKKDILVFFFVEIVLLAIARLYCLLVYHV